MALSLQKQAAFETSKRLIAQTINEGLLSASLRHENGYDTRWLFIQRPEHARSDCGVISVRVAIHTSATEMTTSGEISFLIRPEILDPPITLEKVNGSKSNQYDPGSLFALFNTWFKEELDSDLLSEIVTELRSSAANQVWWIERGRHHIPELGSPSIEWEKTLLWGHPTHPWHRSYVALPPLSPVTPCDLAGMVEPDVTFLSVPRVAVRISGPFEVLLQPLLNKLGISSTHEDRVIVPCLKQQLPSVLIRFQDVDVVGSIRLAQAQSSMRTVTLLPEFEFPYHIKLSLTCRITSALRNITPRSARGGIQVSGLLEKLLPPEMWVYKEVATVCGSQEDMHEAKHLGCILREDLEARAAKCGERLILTAALTQTPVGDLRCYAERLFGIDSISKRMAWLKRYISLLFQLTIPLLANHGICLEGHGQNVVGRFCLKTRELKGFAIRDFDGIRIHVPTLIDQGFNLETVVPDSPIRTNDILPVWNKAHHTLIQMNIGLFISAFELEAHGGWAMVREELLNVLRSEKIKSNGKELYDFITQDFMSFKCFIQMRIENKSSDYIERDVPNVLRRDSDGF